MKDGGVLQTIAIKLKKKSKIRSNFKFLLTMKTVGLPTFNMT